MRARKTATEGLPRPIRRPLVDWLIILGGDSPYCYKALKIQLNLFDIGSRQLAG